MTKEQLELFGRGYNEGYWQGFGEAMKIALEVIKSAHPKYILDPHKTVLTATMKLRGKSVLQDRRSVVLGKLHNTTAGNSGQFPKGHQGGRQFRKGQLPATSKPVIRLDTLETYPSGAALARALGCHQSHVCMAARSAVRVKGIRVMFVDSYNRMQERLREQQPVLQESWKEKAARLNREKMKLNSSTHIHE